MQAEMSDKCSYAAFQHKWKRLLRSSLQGERPDFCDSPRAGAVRQDGMEGTREPGPAGAAGRTGGGSCTHPEALSHLTVAVFLREANET